MCCNFTGEDVALPSDVLKPSRNSRAGFRTLTVRLPHRANEFNIENRRPSTGNTTLWAAISSRYCFACAANQFAAHSLSAASGERPVAAIKLTSSTIRDRRPRLGRRSNISLRRRALLAGAVVNPLCGGECKYRPPPRPRSTVDVQIRFDSQCKRLRQLFPR